MSEADLRNAVAAAAESERGKWLVSSTLQKENHPTRFGDLVRYWLAGSKGDIRPDQLLAAHQAAIDPTIPYGTLVHAALAAAVGRFKAAEAKVNAAIADLYKQWDAIDAAALIVPVAAAKVTAAGSSAGQLGSENAERF